MPAQLHLLGEKGSGWPGDCTRGQGTCRQTPSEIQVRMPPAIWTKPPWARGRRRHSASDLGCPQACSDGSSQGCLPRAACQRIPGRPGQPAARPTGSLQAHEASHSRGGDSRGGIQTRDLKIKLPDPWVLHQEARAGRNSSRKCSFCSKPAPSSSQASKPVGGRAGRGKPSPLCHLSRGGRAFCGGRTDPATPSAPIAPLDQRGL